MLNMVLSWNYNMDVNTVKLEYLKVLNMPYLGSEYVSFPDLMKRG